MKQQNDNFWHPSGESYQSILLAELHRRQLANPQYSLRAYAKDLGLTSGRVSEILNGKQGLSALRARNIADRLGLPEERKSYFIDLVQAKHSRSERERKEAQYRVGLVTGDREYEQVELSRLRCLSDWLPFAILERIKIKNYSPNIQSLSKQFQVSTSQIRSAVHSLTQVGMLRTVGDRWRVISRNTLTGKGVPSLVIKKYHHQLMKRAISALYNQPMHRREFESLIFNLDKTRMNELKNKIRQFILDTDKEFSNDETATDVACISLQMFLLTEDEK